MKQNAAAFDRTLAKGQVNDLPAIVFIYGDDGGAVRQLAKKTVSLVTDDPDDPFAHDKLSVEDVVHTPSRLYDSATTVAFGSGPRLVRVEGFHGDLDANTAKTVSEALTELLSANLQDVVIVITAPRIDAKKAFIRHIEKAPNAVAVRCFQDNIGDMRQVVNQYFSAKNKKVAADAMQFLLDHLGNDRDITTHELDKLDLYTGTATEITLEDCLASLSNAPAATVFKWCDAVGSAHYDTADRLFVHFIEEGEAPQSMQALLHRHQRRLYAAVTDMQAGTSAGAALKNLKPPVTFGQDVFQAQASRISRSRVKPDVLHSLWQDVVLSRSQVADMHALLYATTLHLK